MHLDSPADPLHHLQPLVGAPAPRRGSLGVRRQPARWGMVPASRQGPARLASGRRSWAAFSGAGRRGSRLSGVTGAEERSVRPAEESLGCRPLQAPAPSRASESVTNPRERRLRRRPATGHRGDRPGRQSVHTSLVRREGRGCLSPRRVHCSGLVCSCLLWQVVPSHPWRPCPSLTALCPPYSNLRPPLDLEKKSQLLTICLRSVLALPLLGVLEKHTCLFLEPPDVQVQPRRPHPFSRGFAGRVSSSARCPRLERELVLTPPGPMDTLAHLSHSRCPGGEKASSERGRCLGRIGISGLNPALPPGPALHATPQGWLWMGLSTRGVPPGPGRQPSMWAGSSPDC